MLLTDGVLATLLGDLETALRRAQSLGLSLALALLLLLRLPSTRGWVNSEEMGIHVTVIVKVKLKLRRFFEDLVTFVVEWQV
jgi:hypothetical protein